MLRFSIVKLWNTLFGIWLNLNLSNNFAIYTFSNLNQIAEIWVYLDDII